MATVYITVVTVEASETVIIEWLDSWWLLKKCFVPWSYSEWLRKDGCSRSTLLHAVTQSGFSRTLFHGITRVAAQEVLCSMQLLRVASQEVLCSTQWFLKDIVPWNHKSGL
jgi:hypothetical protein